MNNQNCPLCDRPSKFTFKNYQSHKLFICDTCKVFVIPNREEDYFQSIDQSLKTRYSDISAKLDSDMLFQISIERHGDSVTISHCIVPRTNWS